jgi:hypothetical protein
MSTLYVGYLRIYFDQRVRVLTDIDEVHPSEDVSSVEEWPHVLTNDREDRLLLAKIGNGQKLCISTASTQGTEYLDQH